LRPFIGAPQLAVNSFAMMRCAGISMKQSGARSDTFFCNPQQKTTMKMNPPPLLSKETPLFANCFIFERMPNASNPIVVLESLLKHPGRVVYELHQRRGGILATCSFFSQLSALQFMESSSARNRAQHNSGSRG
jgi:hypothetical protein